MPDALICYPGSIEKLKLLGVADLLTYSTLLSIESHLEWQQAFLFVPMYLILLV
jgi:hypothetical protein